MWWKQNKWKVIIPILTVVVLAAAFWFGGNAPGLQGWSTGDESVAEVIASTPGPSRAPEVSEVPEVSEAPEASEAPEVSEAPKASAAPEPTATPKPTPTPASAPEQEMVIDPKTGKDKYNTDPVPEGKPLPVEPQNATISDVAHTCTISISCGTILNNMSWLDPAKTDLVPADGVILPPTQVTFYEGESVFNVLQRTCKQNKIHMEFENTPMYNSAYIEGINNLYEFDCGELSGWMYNVNGWFPNYGVSRYQVQSGDSINFVYTCDLGKDVGNIYTGG